MFPIAAMLHRRTGFNIRLQAVIITEVLQFVEKQR
jgi:hypothetical protein